MPRTLDSASIAAAAVLAAGALGLWSGPASAAGTGYGPGASQPSTAPGGFSNVVTSQTVPSSGGTVGVVYDGETLVVSVPPGDFATPVQVTISAPSSPPAAGAVTAFAVAFALNGEDVTGSLAAPVVFTIEDPTIRAGDEVDIWSGTAWSPYPDAEVASGKAVITVTSDPTFAIFAASATLPAATTATTGLPVATMGAAADAMGLAGAGGLLVVRRRRTRASARSAERD